MDINGGRLSFDSYIKDTNFEKQISEIEKRILGLSHTTQQESKKMESAFSSLSKGLAAFLTVGAAQGFIRDIIRVRSEFQQLEIAFTTMLGSKEKADQLTKDLIEFAAETPFGMKETANAAKQLLAYGSAAENVKDELKMLGDVAAGTSQPIGDLVYLYGTLRTQGRAYTQDIRQFAGRGIPIYKELAAVLGVAEDQVNDFVSSGKVGFAEIEKAFQNMTAAGSMFGGLMEAQSKTIQGDLERLSDAFEQVLNDIGKSNEGVISSTIQGAAYIVENYEKVLDIITGLVVVYGSYRAALIATTALQQLSAARAVGLTAAELLHLGAITAKTAAMRVLNAVMLASPIGAITAAIAALVAIVYSLTQVTNATAAAQDTFNKILEESASSADNEKRSIEQLVGVIQDHTSSVEQKKAAYDKLLSQTGGILHSFTQEEIAAGKAADALDIYIQKVREAALARAAFDEYNKLADELDALNRKGIEGVGTWAKLGRSLKNTFSSVEGRTWKGYFNELFSGDASDTRILSQEKEVLEKQMDELKASFGEKWSEYISGVKDELQSGKETLKDDFSNFYKILGGVENKSELDALKKRTQEALEALSPNDARIAEFKKRLESIAKIESQYSLTKKGGRNNSEYQQNERLISINRELDRAKEQALFSQLSRDEQELASAKAKYDNLRDEVRKFNDNPDNKIKIDASLVDNIAQDELDFIVSNQRVRKELENIENLEKVYDRLAEITIRVNELRKLQSQGSLTPDQGFELDQYTEKQKQYQQQLQREAERLSRTHKDVLIEIEDDYQARVIALGDKATPEKIAQLTRVRNEEIKQANETEAQKLTILMHGLETQMVVTLSALNEQKKAIEKLLLDTSLPPELRDRLLGDLKRINESIQMGADVATIANFKKRQASLLSELKKLEEAGLKGTEEWKKLYEEIKKVSAEAEAFSKDKLTNLLDMILNLSSSIGELGDSLSNLGDAFGNSGLSGIGDALSGIASNIGNISVAFDESASSTDQYAAAIQGVITLISIVANAAAERKRAEEEYYRSVIQLQNDFNLSLIERQRLEAELGESVYLKDYVGRMRGAMESSKEATKQYQEAIKKLIDTGKGKDGLRNAIGWGAVGQGAAAGAAVGAVVGTIVPVIGNVIGAAVGAVVGGLIGLFGGTKKKDTYSSLISQYPELREYLDGNSLEDLQDVRNLAEQLIKNNAVDNATKQQLENIIGLIDEIEAAREQIREVVRDLSGDMGSNLRNSLVNAFKSGEDAALAMGKTVSQVLENILTEILFNKAFEQLFKSFEDNLTDAMLTFALTGDESAIIESMSDFLDAAGPAGENFHRWMEMAKGQAANKGISIFEPTTPQDEQASFKGRIEPKMTEQQANLQYAISLRQLDVITRIEQHVLKSDPEAFLHVGAQQIVLLQYQFDVLRNIDTNTFNTSLKLDRLEKLDQLEGMNAQLEKISLNTDSKQSRQGLYGA